MSSVVEIESARAESRLLAELRERFRVGRERRARRELTFYDTFEWKLQRKGTTLATWQDGERPVIRWQEADGRLLHRMLGVPLPGFARELPAGVFREALTQQVGVRRLLPLVCLELRIRELPILDDNRKTVARAIFERGFARGPQPDDPRRKLPGSLTVRPLTGYEQEAAQVARFIERELDLPAAEPSLLLRALAAAGEKTHPPGLEAPPELPPGTSSDAATRSVLLRLYAAMRLNEDGLRRDLDSEFLHDFRVAVRRTRAALGQLKRVFPERALERFRSDFKWLGDLTGPTRDLDVYLLKLPAYRDLLPPDLRTELDPLEQLLVERQRAEHRRLVRGLETTRYAALLRDWPEFLEGEASDETQPPAARLPVAELASERILRLHRRVLKRGRKAIDAPSAERMHRLRLECKKFRYLIEFFAELYPPKETRRALRSLKRLQDNLGDFNDLEVQQDALSGFARDLAANGTEHERTLLALGRLVERLAVEQERERSAVRKRFESFAERENQQRIRALFSGARRKA
jgi:CHAD domain-containing protein